MRGRYERAPLSYVTARLVIKELTALYPEQALFLIQKMKQIGFIYREKAAGRKIKVTLNPDVETQKVISDDIERVCFLTSERTTAVLFDEKGIEFRTTKYNRFDDLCELFQSVIDVTTQVDIYNSLKIEEVVLSYVDVIVAPEGYELGDFFCHGKNVLPMTFFDGDCLISFGKTQINKVLKKNHRVEISIEELPQRANKYVPRELVEAEKSFQMPIDIPCKLEPESDKKYILVTTRGYELHGEEIIRDRNNDTLQGKSIRDFFEQSHKTCRNEFNSLINKDVCDVVWGYVED